MSKQSSTYLNNDIVAISGIIFLCIAVVSQFFGYLNPDNAWIVYVADQVAGGRELHKEVIETNPPLIVYLTLIPAYFSDATGIADYHSFTLYIFAIAALVIWLCFKLTQSAWIRAGILYLFFFYAGYNFGQREHLFLMLVSPYILAVLGDNKSNKLVFASAVLAAIGFAVKPYYIILWAFVELFAAYQKRSFHSLFCMRNFVIGILMLCYLHFLFDIEKDYVKNILPLMLEYYGGFSWDFEAVLKNVMVYLIFFQMPLVVAIVKYPKAITKEIVFFSACNVICILIVLFQQKSWSNHYYPAAGFGILLNILLVAEMMKNAKPKWNKIIITSSVFVLAMTMLVAASTNLTKASRIKSDKTIQKIKIINEHAHGGYVYPLSFDLPLLFPAILYSDAKYGSRYGHLWMLPGLYVGADLDEDSEVVYRKPFRRDDDETMLVADILADIAHNPPQLIFVAKRKYNTAAIGDFKFDFVEYMSLQKEFREIFSNYEKLMEIDEQVIYKYKGE